MRKGKNRKRQAKDKVVTTVAVLMLLFSAMMTWNVYSLLVFVAVLLLLAAWYVRD